MTDNDKSPDATQRDEIGNIAPSLEAVRERALELLLQGATCPEVAVELEVHRSTVWRWTRTPKFARHLRAVATERIQAASVRLDLALGTAIDLLEDVVVDKQQPVTVRVRAAEALLRRLTPCEPKASDDEPLSADERIEYLVNALKDPDDELTRALEQVGLVRVAAAPGETT